MASTTELLSRGVAAMNALATVFLVVGFLRIRRGDRAGHGKAMATAFVTSALFLALYLASKVHLWVALGKTNILYRPEVGLTWDKLLYYVILFPHILLAIAVTPFIIRAVMLARAGRFEDHKRLTIEVDDGPFGYLVLADTWLPGWTATIDGEELPIARGNVCMRIVPLPNKACILEFRYRTPGLVPGLAITAVALLIAAWLVWRARAAAQAN